MFTELNKLGLHSNFVARRFTILKELFAKTIFFYILTSDLDLG